MRVQAALLLLFCTPLAIVAQLETTDTTSKAVKDATAMNVASQAMAAMVSGPQPSAVYQDVTASGTLVIHQAGDKDANYKVVLKSKGTNLFRRDIQKPDGISSFVQNYGVSCLKTPKDSLFGVAQNAVASRVDYIPALSLLSEYVSPDKQVQDAGTDSINGAPAAVVAISFEPPGLPLSRAELLQATQHSYWIDQATGYVVKVRYRQFAENARNAPFLAEMYFSDYRNVDGLMVPFRRIRYLDGKLSDELTLTSVTLNTGLPDSDFDLPCEVANAQ